MKIEFWSIGKQHESYVKEGIQLFTSRLSHYYKTDWKIMPTVKNAAALTEADLRLAEGKMILQSLVQDQFLVLLEETGQMMSSPALALLLEQRAMEGTKTLVFLIGGAFGVSEAVKQRANLKWSLSDLVFPHQIVRMLLAEQVYRACTINNNEKYHHS